MSWHCASTIAIGACLMQLDEANYLRPVRFGSRRLTPAERNWPIYELEGFAVVHFMLAFRPYLIGGTFTVRSDHKPLQWLWKIDKPRLVRWSMTLQQFDFKIVYNPGTAREQVDIFTRDVRLTPRIAKEVTPVPDGCIIQEKLLVQAKSGLMYVPERLRARILLYYHYSRVGAQKMIVRIKKHFYWSLLARDCVDFTAGCLTCQRRMNVVNLVGKGVLLSTDFNILVSVDAIGPFMYKKKSYNLITTT
ncbi:putative RNase HI in long-term repeat retroelement Ty3/gypsy family protein [Gregarina niphandrodes]|uniref:RNase HI in long-term repeat retroelement Ty3/gypsy family protein n=1 Tax=Gregarina niphandrodes TaxID=110365 RepID=A0A023AWL2_GRENI|nr:putative RNase HI in long-term repeat retroelement Ty3/gypsy family protein [Gregarina niphandrodes]EZG43104.1 putative RNase HI in long-term repeat retroelement Ty3/gypsy family protein [Gregarina niphandrodes]|eukprot:XP_011133639.1 putative RNase HI in long-term repeat retroelement Ty3/gypsy family protein [Gregarina niphandrodes]